MKLKPEKLSANLSKVVGSVTAEIFAESKRMMRNGIPVVNFAIGQPDFLPLPQILDATADYVKGGYVQYTESKGIIELRTAISEYYRVQVNPETQVVVTTGGKLGIFAAIWAVCNPGDNVIILDPSWVSYQSIVESLGCVPKFVRIGTDFSFNEDGLERLIDDRTKAVIVNSPCNPTGQIIPRQNLQKLYDFCIQHGLLLVSDEIYNEYVYPDNQFTSLAAIKNWEDNGVIVNGFSKTFAMTGYRVGYTITNELLSKEINKVMQLTASCAPIFSQYAAVTALKSIDEMRKKIQEVMFPRRHLMVKLSSELGLDLQPPQGAMYGWFMLPDSTDSAKWAAALLKEKAVSVTPGIGFGPHGESAFRICFAVPEDTIADGLTKISQFIQSFH